MYMVTYLKILIFLFSLINISRSEETKLNYIELQLNWIFVVPSMHDKKKTAPDPYF